MSGSTDKSYDEFMARIDADDYEFSPDSVVERGTPESHARMRAMLLEAAEGDPETVAMIERVSGRPSLGHDRPAGHSPMWKVRTDAELDAQARAYADRTHQSLSDVIRTATSEYLAAHPA